MIPIAHQEISSWSENTQVHRMGTETTLRTMRQLAVIPRTAHAHV